MPIPVILPTLGPAIEEATLVKWLVPIGAFVRRGDPLFSVETDKTLTDTRAWLARLESIRLAGYALDEGECDDELRTLAAPVFDAQGSVIAAVSLAGPSSRLTKKTMRQLVPQVVDAARVISQRMGWAPTGA